MVTVVWAWGFPVKSTIMVSPFCSGIVSSNAGSGVVGGGGGGGLWRSGEAAAGQGQGRGRQTGHPDKMS